MERIKEFDSVILHDGRKGAVVEILGDQDKFLVDIGSSEADWETIMVSRQAIERVI